MIQFNLLPDIKLDYIRSKRNKHMVLVTCFIVAGSSVALLVLVYMGVAVLQKKHLNDLTKDIASKTQKLQNTPDLNKILTIQNQLNNLDGLHDKKPLTSRFFSFANQITPASVTISATTLDFAKSTISVTGNAPDLSTVNKFVDTIKFTKYKYPELDGQGKPMTDDKGKPKYVTGNAFSSVVLTTFTLTVDGKTKVPKTTYQIDFTFDPIIFDITKDITLDVPVQITTRSETEKPTIFDEGSKNNTNDSQQQGQ